MSTIKVSKPNVVLAEGSDTNESLGWLKKLFVGSFCDPTRADSDSDEEESTSAASAPSDGPLYFRRGISPIKRYSQPKAQIRKEKPVVSRMEEDPSTAKEIVTRELAIEEPQSSTTQNRVSKVGNLIKRWEVGIETPNSANRAEQKTAPKSRETNKKDSQLSSSRGIKMRIASVFILFATAFMAMLFFIHNSGFYEIDAMYSIENVQNQLIEHKERMTVEFKKMESMLRTENQNWMYFSSEQKIDKGNDLQHAQNRMTTPEEESS